MIFQIGIGIAIAIPISISDEDRDRDRDLDFGDRGHALLFTYGESYKDFILGYSRLPKVSYKYSDSDNYQE